MSKRLKFLLLIILLIGLGFIGFVSFIKYKNSFQYLTVNYKHLDSIKLYNNQNLDHITFVQDITKTGQTLKLKKSNYLIKYTGSTGYKSLYQSFALTDSKKTITIKPEYTDKKLDMLLDSELNTIKASLISKYPKSNHYKIERGQLYQKGDWYSTVLDYIGDDSFNSDNLRVVLHKNNDTWSVVTDPPSITLSEIAYPSIPKNILDDINTLKNKPASPPPIKTSGPNR